MKKNVHPAFSACNGQKPHYSEAISNGDTDMTTAPNFEIIRLTARYDDYDCVVGWSGRRVAVAYTEAWAFVLNDREDQDYDVRSEVREVATGKRVHRTFAPVTDLPF